MRIALLVGTRKGGFIAFSDASRRSWDVRGPFFKGVEVNHVGYVRNHGVTATYKSAWWGPGVQLSRDWGETWQDIPGSIHFAPDRGRSVERIWIIKVDERSPRSVLVRRSRSRFAVPQR